MARRALSLLQRAAVLAEMVVSCACVAARDSDASQVQREPLYVLSGLDAQVTVLDGASGAALSTPLSVGRAPHLFAVDRGGTLLVALDSGLELIRAAAASAGASSTRAPRGTLGERWSLALEDGVRPR